jgi:hypothetical protein
MRCYNVILLESTVDLLIEALQYYSPSHGGLREDCETLIKALSKLKEMSKI